MRRVLLYVAPYAAYTAIVLFLFWSPLMQGWGSIQWDAVGVHFLNLAHTSDMLRQGLLPEWTPYIFGGFPQIADMQVALWYPPIFALAAFTTLSATGLMWEIVLHYILAASFMYLLARELTTPRPAAWGIGLAYALGGFMVGHASHVGMMNAAALLPLVFLLLLRTLERNSTRYAIACGITLGISMLAGHFQVSLYSALFVGLYSAWAVVPPLMQRRWHDALRVVGLVGIVGVFAAGVAAVQYVPTFQLVAQSERSAIPLSVAQSESLKPGALTGIVSWNHLGVATGPYTGPWDRTQNYLFIGLSTALFALVAIVLGIRNRETRPKTLFFTGVTLFAVAYALGPATPLHGLLYHVPLLGTVRAPGNMLLLAHLSLLCLAAISWKYIPSKAIRWLPWFCAVVIAAELVPKALHNELLWGRQTPSRIFANAPIAQRVLDEYRTLPAEKRFRVWRVPGLDANEPQYWKIDDFGGYNPLELARHARYTEAMTESPRLMALAGIRYGPCDFIPGSQLPAPWAPHTCRTESQLPRAFMVGRMQTSENDEDALAQLKQIEPFSTAVVERSSAAEEPAALSGTGPFGYDVRITNQRAGYMRLKVRTTRDALLVITQTFWPGWTATVDGKEVPLWRTDYLFQGVRTPTGEHTIELTYRSRAFAAGAAVTLATLCGAAAYLLLWKRPGRSVPKTV